jgi:hypothetical protein
MSVNKKGLPHRDKPVNFLIQKSLKGGATHRVISMMVVV